MNTATQVKDEVKEKYGSAARSVALPYFSFSSFTCVCRTPSYTLSRIYPWLGTYVSMHMGHEFTGKSADGNPLFAALADHYVSTDAGSEEGCQIPVDLARELILP